MTIPHLMNCSHMGDGWCLDCVNEAWEINQEEVIKLRQSLHSACDRLNDGTAWAASSEDFLEMCKIARHSHPCLGESGDER